MAGGAPTGIGESPVSSTLRRATDSQNLGAHLIATPVMPSIRSTFDSYRASRIAGFLQDFIRPTHSVLDFGAGSMKVAEAVQRDLSAQVIGVDVLRSENGSLPFSLYDGRRLPFRTSTFDGCYLAFVLHHTHRPTIALRECLRVSSGHVIILEDVYRGPAEKLALRFFDWLGNRPFHAEMQLTFNFRTDREWREMISGLGADLVASRSIRPIPWRPTRHRMYVVRVPSHGRLSSDPRYRG